VARYSTKLMLRSEIEMPLSKADRPFPARAAPPVGLACLLAAFLSRLSPDTGKLPTSSRWPAGCCSTRLLSLGLCVPEE